MKKFAALFIVAVLVVSFVSVSAQEKKSCASSCKSTALDSETKVKVEKLKLQYELDTVDLKAEKDQLKKSLMTELMKEDASSKSIDKIVKAMNTNHSKSLNLKMDYLLKVKKVLPADHFDKFIMKGQGCAPGCRKPCCATKSTGCKSSSGCSKSASKCSKAGTAGHTCTSSCKTASAGCETPCSVKVKK
jgi:hypothetical protein